MKWPSVYCDAGVSAAPWRRTMWSPRPTDSGTFAQISGRRLGSCANGQSSAEWVSNVFKAASTSCSRQKQDSLSSITRHIPAGRIRGRHAYLVMLLSWAFTPSFVPQRLARKSNLCSFIFLSLGRCCASRCPERGEGADTACKFFKYWSSGSSAALQLSTRPTPTRAECREPE